MSDITTDPTTLRLVWPQWQGAGAATVAELLPGMPVDKARRGYTVGTRVLDALLPEHNGPTEVVPVDGGEPDEGHTNGVESRSAVLAALEAGQQAITRHPHDRILTLGGECSVSVVPFTGLAACYGDDLAVIWIDSHPDTDTPETGYDGYRAMAVSAITGHGDPEILDRLPAHVNPSRVALVGIHAWEDDAYANVDEWGLTTFSPDQLRTDSSALTEWIAATGTSRVAVHLDVDTVDSDEVSLGLGQIPGGLTLGQVRRVLADVSAAADVVGMTVAEFIPRDVLAVLDLVEDLPLLD